MTRLLASLLILAALFAAPLHAQQAQPAALQPLDRIAAVVDDGVILQSELDRAVQNIHAQYASRPGQLPPEDVLRKQVLERLVLVRLQVARAAESGIHVGDQEVDAALVNIARQNNMTPDQLRAQLAQHGESWAEFRESIRDEITIQRLRQRFAQTRISVSDAEVDAALEASAGGQQYHLANILVALPEGATPEQIATGQQKVDGIKALIDRGEMDFQAAAVRYSDSPNALEGGDLGWRSLDEIPAAFANVIRSMQPGQVIGPTRGASGFQLLKLLETREGSAAEPRMVTQFNARHILIRTGEGGLGEDEARAKIDTLAARIAGGADFQALARENSQDPVSAPAGGDLGWFTQEAYGPEFGAQVAALQDGQVSAPFKTQAGWHIVQRVGSRQADVGAENRRAQVREAIGQRKLEDEWARYLREIRGDAYVDFRIGDAAATPEPEAAPSATPPADGTAG
ncbi:MAG TPA: peptidylprolyl isomerase [Xanthomonadaceae bacterium]|nr:peptidylprolyl isomerase [Xanthomonadaceae bacterium]